MNRKAGRGNAEPSAAQLELSLPGAWPDSLAQQFATHDKEHEPDSEEEVSITPYARFQNGKFGRFRIVVHMDRHPHGVAIHVRLCNGCRIIRKMREI